MRKSKLTDSQIMTVLKRAEVGEAVPDLCRELDAPPLSVALGTRVRG